MAGGYIVGNINYGICVCVLKGWSINGVNDSLSKIYCASIVIWSVILAFSYLEGTS